jgi:hypothetical protein
MRFAERVEFWRALSMACAGGFRRMGPAEEAIRHGEGCGAGGRREAR